MEDEILNYENLDLNNVYHMINYEVLEELLNKSNYSKSETKFLVSSFRDRFDLCYKRPEKVKLTAPNLKLRIGNERILWNKVMKEVKEGRYVGPFEQIPFEEDYIQSPIGLVPKDGGCKCRLSHIKV